MMLLFMLEKCKREPCSFKYSMYHFNTAFTNNLTWKAYIKKAQVMQIINKVLPFV